MPISEMSKEHSGLHRKRMALINCRGNGKVIIQNKLTVNVLRRGNYIQKKCSEVSLRVCLCADFEEVVL